MKSLIVCQEEVSRKIDGFFEMAALGDYPLTLGLMDTDPIRFEKKRTHKNDVLVEKSAFSVNYRDRSWILRNYEKGIRNSGNELFYFGICSEFVGVVTKTGANVTSLSEGDRVIPVATYPADIPGIPHGIPSNYASRRQDIFREGQLIKVPATISDEQAAGFTIGAQTAYSIVRRLQIVAGAVILVTAATSNTSLFVLEALKHLQVDIYTLSTRQGYGEVLAQMGIPVRRAFTGVEEMRGQEIEFDIIIDPFADIYLSLVMPYTRMGAHYITCGIHWQPYDHTPGTSHTRNIDLPTFSLLIGRNITITGNCLGNRMDLANAITDAAEDRLRVHIDSVYKGHQLKAFFDRGFNDRERFGKVIYKYIA